MIYMNNTLKTIIALLVVTAIGIFIYSQIKQQAPIVTESSIAGCYVATLGQDVYTLTVTSQTGKSFTGNLSFKNFEKDSSSGTFVGEYKEGFLLGDYSFQSEGMFSVMQVIFKRVGNDFVRGFGDVDDETGTRFTDLTTITYDSSAVFKWSPEGCSVTSN